MAEEINKVISSFNWEQFHFLRPKALYLFVPLAFILLLLILSNRERKKWKVIIAPALQPFMFSKGSPWSLVLPLLFFAISTTFAIFSLAGPTWKKRELPKEKINAVVLLALDMSRSMTATDIQPNRLERAKFKISDFLDANPRARAGLIAFAGTAHPVLPFTSDYKLIKHHASSLVNHIMPVDGTDMGMLIEVVDSMMSKISAPSTVVLMTDEITSDDAILLTNYLNGNRHRMEILLFSTPNGAQVPGHPHVLSKQDQSVIQNLAQDTAIHVTSITLDKSDVESVAHRISDKLVFEKEIEKKEQEWDDMGLLFLLPAILITLFWFRKGWVIQWCWIGIGIALLQSCGVDSKHPDWWYSTDYQGQLFEDAGKFEEAADHFEDNQHKAAAYFKAGNYEAAADLFSLDSSATSTYNKGLALAMMGRYDEAMISFNDAIQLDPSLSDKVNNSIAQTRNAQQRADSVLKYDPASVGGQMKELAENKKKGDPLKERKAQSKDEELSSDTQVKKLPTTGDRITDEVESNVHRFKEAETPPKDFKSEPQSAEDILLRRTAADPSEFLHRRFELQVKRYYKNVKKPKNPW